MQGKLDIQDAGYNIGVNVIINQRDAKTGRILEHREGHNRCLRTQLLGITKWLNGEFNESQSYLEHYNWIPRYLAVGTNQATMESTPGITSEVSMNDTRLLTELSPRMKLPERNKIINRSTQDYVQLVITHYIPEEYYNGETLREAGLFSREEGNNCLFRIVFDGINKTEDSVIEINWVISVISVDSQNQPYEGVNKADLYNKCLESLSELARINPDFTKICEDMHKAIFDYGRQDASQNELDETTAILETDLEQLRPMSPGSSVIPEGYYYTGNANITDNDVMFEKIGYNSNGQVTGKIKHYDKLSIYKNDSTTVHSDISIQIKTTPTGTKYYMVIDNKLNISNDGENCLVTSGEYAVDVNVQQDVLAEFFGITPNVIKEGVTIMGVRGRYRGDA